MKYIALFILIQLLNLPLMVLGWFICALPYPMVPWLWRNDDDNQLLLLMGKWEEYVYIAWRNPVANLRHVKGVSGKGRPLWYKTWTIPKYEYHGPFFGGGWPSEPRQFYVKAGWMSDGLPCLSAGSGKGY